MVLIMREKHTCKICKIPLVKKKITMNEKHQFMYEERCALCENLLYGVVK